MPSLKCLALLNAVPFGPPWRDFYGIICLRCRVHQTDAVDQSHIKSGLGQGEFNRAGGSRGIEENASSLSREGDLGNSPCGDDP
jgi:hypothetical protein